MDWGNSAIKTINLGGEHNQEEKKKEKSEARTISVQEAADADGAPVSALTFHHLEGQRELSDVPHILQHREVSSEKEDIARAKGRAEQKETFWCCRDTLSTESRTLTGMFFCWWRK